MKKNSEIGLKKPDISVFFPCYNDEKTIGELVKEADKILKLVANKYEIIVIDDMSSDGSRRVLRKLSKENKLVKTVFHKSNQGYGGALRSGFKAAKYEWIFYTDGDGQYDVEELPILVSLMSNDVDFVNGIKMGRSDSTLRIVVGNIYSLFARWAFWLPVWDVDCDFRLIKKSIIDKISLEANSGAICIELVKKSAMVGARFRQVSVHHLERRHGSSQFFRVERILQTGLEVSKLWIKLRLYNYAN